MRVRTFKNHTFILKRTHTQTHTHTHTVLQCTVAVLTPQREKVFVPSENVLESTWAAGRLLCSGPYPLTSPQRLCYSHIGWAAHTITLTYTPSSLRRHSCCTSVRVFIRSVAVWSSGAREDAGWRWKGWRAAPPWWWLWRRSRRGVEGESQEPRPESCWSDSTCSPASSLRHCLLSGHKHKHKHRKRVIVIAYCHLLMWHSLGGFRLSLKTDLKGKMNK